MQRGFYNKLRPAGLNLFNGERSFASLHSSCTKWASGVHETRLVGRSREIYKNVFICNKIAVNIFLFRSFL